MDLTTEHLQDLYNQNQPKTYGEVAQLFEDNYQKFSQLVPLIDSTYHDSRICHTHKQDLYLLMVERSAHTGVFILTHQINGVNKPDVKFKVYFDAKLLEVMSICEMDTINQSHPYLAKCSDMDIKYEINAFMQKWLDFCLDQYKDNPWQTL